MFMPTDDRSGGEWPAKQPISQKEPEVISDTEAVTWISILSLIVLSGMFLVYGLILHFAEAATHLATKAS